MTTPHQALGCILIVSGPQAGTFVPIGGSGHAVVIGREPGAGTGMQLLDPVASRRHFSVKFDADLERFSIADLGSANGTLLNGRTLPPPPAESTLTEDDEIVAGDTVLMLSVEVPADRASALAMIRKVSERGKSTIVRRPGDHRGGAARS
jgi:pSer/pThr/pTyr-binding forkhead associated (FHA) protein